MPVPHLCRPHLSRPHRAVLVLTAPAVGAVCIAWQLAQGAVAAGRAPSGADLPAVPPPPVRSPQTEGERPTATTHALPAASTRRNRA